MILVFKTNILDKMEIHVKSVLDIFSQISTVDFDFEDRDNILRVETVNNISYEITELLNSKGFQCQELV